MKKKMTAIALTLILAMGLALPAFAASVTDFADVPENAWYYDYVRTARDRGLISGTSVTTFSPNDTMTRGQFVTVLGRFAQVDVSATLYSGNFTDVVPSAYYTPYIAWAASNGIVTGVTCDVFEPDTAITKEQMATIIVRYADSAGLTIPVDSSVNFTFGDAASISDYARDSVEALKNAGIITGNEYGNFQPQKSISRAEATTMLVKFIAVISNTGDTDEPVETPDPNVIECISLDVGRDLTIAPGDTYLIPVTFNPVNTTDKSLTFESLDVSVASVDKNGLVTGVSVGKTRIFVTAANGVSAYVILNVRGSNVSPVAFELAWGDEWQIGTYTGSDGVSYYSYDWAMMGETTTQTSKIGEHSVYFLLSPRVTYADGHKSIVLPESYRGFMFTFTSSNPSLVTLNSASQIIVHRAISADEEPQTVTITVHSGFFNTSKTATITLYAS